MLLSWLLAAFTSWVVLLRLRRKSEAFPRSTDAEAEGRRKKAKKEDRGEERKKEGRKEGKKERKRKNREQSPEKKRT